MKWLTFVGPLLKAKLALIGLLGQVYLFDLIIPLEITHVERLVELTLTSILLWSCYGIVGYADHISLSMKLHEQEREFQGYLDSAKVEHQVEVEKLKGQLLQYEMISNCHST